MLSASLIAGSLSGAAPAATAGNGCTQEDMTALVLSLPSSAGPIEVEVAGAPKPGARSVELSGLRRDPATAPRDLARANLRRADGVEWLRGTLRLRRVDPGTGASGEYDFRRADGTLLRGAFEATWVPGSVNCG